MPIPPDRRDDPPAGDETIVPLVAEEVAVVRRDVERGRVRVDVETHVETRHLDVPLSVEVAEITRVPVGRRVDGMPPVRREGDTLVVPVMEEEVVVERRLVLKEEVRIRLAKTERRHVEDVPVRVETVRVKRQGPAQDEGGT